VAEHGPHSASGVRVAVIDLGTNSTRLLVADVAADGAVAELERRSIVTRLGDRVDATGRLDDAAMRRVLAVLADYRACLDEHGVAAAAGYLTSAGRDAANGDEFAATIHRRLGLDARVIDGDTEARLTYAGATSERPDDGRCRVVIDVGGGSTELVVGLDGEVAFHVSTQAGVVRQTERHLHADPPTPAQLQALRAEAADTFTAAVPPDVRAQVQAGVAVAGTATSGAAMLQRLERYDSARVHGFVLRREAVETLLRRVGQMTEAQRRRLPGLHPDRAGVIVAGLALQLEAMRAFGLDAVEVSEHDLMRGAALELAAHRRRRRDDAGTGVG
jgi:exopolyphosphatase/guanosine-5'-triphosphate,3'-diphosphate pyrophosphatase